MSYSAFLNLKEVQDRIMKIKLSDHFTYGRLFRFVLPSIAMMIFTSIYGVVDGFFVSNYAGKTEFAAVNLIMPFPMMLGAFGFMIGTGGSALVSITLGEGKKKEANEFFSMLIYVTIVVGFVLTVLGVLFTEQIAVLLGAEGEILKHCVKYGRILLLALVPFMLQNVFQSFLVTAEKPTFGLVITVIAGLTNIVLDYIFIGLLDGGVVGAALATAISQFVGGLVPLIYFILPNKSLLKLGKAKWSMSALGKTCFNGSSELMTNLSISFVNMLYNYQLMEIAKEDGVAAYGVIMYVNFIFIAVFIGYAIGTAPIIGYHYGAGNKEEMKNVYKKSILFNIAAGILMCIVAIFLAGPLSNLFVGYDLALYEMTKWGFTVYSISFVVMGLNIYGSSFFTALGNGLISALISFLRTLLFQAVAVMVLPIFFGLNGVWFAIVAAEGVALVVTLIFLGCYRKKYGY